MLLLAAFATVTLPWRIAICRIPQRCCQRAMLLLSHITITRFDMLTLIRRFRLRYYALHNTMLY